MATLDYSDSVDCAARVRERTGVDDQLLIDDILQDTAGKDRAGNTVYRPYWAASVILDMKLNSLVSAEGATFRDVQQNIRALQLHQWSVDESLGTVVPQAMTRDGARRARIQRTRILPLVQD